MELVLKSDNSNSCKNYGQADSRGNETAGPATFPALCEAGTGKGQGDSRRDSVSGTKT